MDLTALTRAWSLQPDVCPCDVHFVTYLRAEDVRRRVIFHFGSGDHHLVGIENAKTDANDILAITASQREHSSYVELLRKTPAIGRKYKVILGDIYDLCGPLLPLTDIVTLFHLGEYFWSDAFYKPLLDDRGVLSLFCKIVKPGGLLFFYRGSWAFATARGLIDEFERAGHISFLKDFESLVVYRVTP